MTRTVLFAVAACVWVAPFNHVLAQPSLTLLPSGPQSVIYWAGSPNSYLLQSATNVNATNWVSADDALPVNAFTVSNAAPQRFFRLAAVGADQIVPNMAYIPGGSFTMGDVLGEEVNAAPIDVYVSGFYMLKTAVAFTRWQNYYSLATNAQSAPNGHIYDFDNAGNYLGGKFPVLGVNWFDCVKWCNAYSEYWGFTPCYYLDANFTQVYRTGQTAPYVKWSANGFRLPTEAEWEKGARGGLAGRRFPWGDLISCYQADYNSFTNNGFNPPPYDLGPHGVLNPIAVLKGNSVFTPGGSFDANGYGLQDMAGQTIQWCWDGWEPLLGQPTTNNPTGYDYMGAGIHRAARGGGPGNGASGCTCACRLFHYSPGSNYPWLSFRFVRRP
jgi:formylglycine-generating enzyme